MLLLYWKKSKTAYNLLLNLQCLSNGVFYIKNMLLVYRGPNKTLPQKHRPTFEGVAKSRQRLPAITAIRFNRSTQVALPLRRGLMAKEEGAEEELEKEDQMEEEKAEEEEKEQLEGGGVGGGGE